MNYALIENGIVKNIIVLNPKNAADFPQAVPFQDIPVNIGDVYKDGCFYRNNEKVISFLDALLIENKEQDSIIAELDAALLDSTYQNIMGSIE